MISSCTSAWTAYHSRVKAEADVKIQLSSVKPDVKEICKVYSSVMFLINYLYFRKKLFLKNHLC